ncbi:MAG: cytochrome c3 family protein [Desulfobacteraceae bacterium]|nr:cytochrome c3 family protein [Desulfobacteraceae bacterium]
MKKSIGSILILCTIFLFGWVSVHSQEEMEVVDNSVFDQPRRTSSLFMHDDHNESAGIEECHVCHHVYEDGELLEDESSEDSSCSECHEIDASGDMPGLMMAYHLNCKGCHLKEKKGPVLCGECHHK